MKIATFNANSIRSRMEIVSDWLAQQQPDFLCIQETKVTDPQFPQAAVEERGYHVRFRGEKSYNGVAILSKNEPDEVIEGFDDDGPADASRFLAARFNDLWILNTYVPQGRELDHEMYAYKLAWFARLKQWMTKHLSAQQPVIWCGDINVARTPLDVSNPERKKNHVCYHEDVRTAFENVLLWGFDDVFRTFHPDERIYSFFDYRVRGAIENNQGWRIDYVLTTAPLTAKARSAYIDIEPRKKEKPSDHTFLVAEFDD
ncbi:MAG: exodeoxyribonuclease III [Spartobacteria bacterium]|nr:exodeoxyribonuclease III [Spartobacteria bacterium]